MNRTDKADKDVCLGCASWQRKPAPRRLVMRIRIGALLAMAMWGAMLGGCYYQVYDARTGKFYYTDEWVAADGYRGPLTIKDESGRKVRLPDARVNRIGKDEFIEATTTEETPPN